MGDVLARALQAQTAEQCARELEAVPERFHGFPEAMEEALRGQWSAVTVLVRRWHFLVDDLLQSASEELPELVKRFDHHFAMRTASGELSEDPVRFLDQLIWEVPFSPLLSYGGEVGVGVVAIDATRSLLPGWSALRVEMSHGWRDLPPRSDPDRYHRLVDLAIRSMQPPLIRVKELFGLNTAEVGELFGVTRQAVEQWEEGGEVPGARREKLANVLAVGELLERKLSPGRLPLVARRRADVYAGRTMLEMIASGLDAELLDLTERAFDWSATA